MAKSSGAGKGGGRGRQKAAGRGSRSLTTRVKTARGRTTSSQIWLQRQLNDPYVQEAKRRGYRSRAAFKLAELDDRFHFLKTGGRIVDLGAAPGGWTQIALERVGPKGRVIGIDIADMEAITGAEIMLGDFLDPDVPGKLRALLGGSADVVLSDMAAPATGHTGTDHLRIMALLEAAAVFAEEVLAPGGTFVGKVLRGGSENEVLSMLKMRFRQVRHAKPPASRSDSAEIYVVAMDFRPES